MILVALLHAALAQDMAATFPGELDGILVGAIRPGGAYTVEMWARLDVVDEDTFICTSNAAYVSAFCVQYRSDFWMVKVNDDDAIEADTCTDTEPHICLDDDLTAPVTLHVAVTVSPSRIALFVDGVEVASASNGAVTRWTGMEWAIGIDAEPDLPPLPAGWNNDTLDGLIDEVRIWHGVRSADDIACTKGWALTGEEDGLAALWHLDTATGGVTPDATGNGHDGTLLNTATLVPSPFGLSVSAGGDIGCFDFDLDGVTPDGGDCDDLDPTIHEGADEIRDDGIDQDCDGDDTTTRLQGGLARCGCDAGASGGAWGLVVLLIAAQRRARTRVGQRSPSS